MPGVDIIKFRQFCNTLRRECYDMGSALESIWVSEYIFSCLLEASLATTVTGGRRFNWIEPTVYNRKDTISIDGIRIMRSVKLGNNPPYSHRLVLSSLKVIPSNSEAIPVHVDE